MANPTATEDQAMMQANRNEVLGAAGDGANAQAERDVRARVRRVR